MPLAITPGEPAGIGPDIVLVSAGKALPRPIVAISNKALLEQRASLLGLQVKLETITLEQVKQIEVHQPGVLPLIDVPLAANNMLPGKPAVGAAKYLLQTLDVAVQGCLQGHFHAMVTGPLQKSGINEAGIPFSGHTEYLAERTKAKHVVMMLVSSRMRVALLTTHLPLAQVPGALNKERLSLTLDVLHQSLQQTFAIKQPRIGVCGLNPHAGESGYLGSEEIEIIQPVIEQYQSKGMLVEGPLPADTAFTPEKRKCYHVILAMYHDQGLPVIKSQDFGETVNITLGLPLIRTSVDHGVALSLAGTGKANPRSMLAAIEAAHRLGVCLCNNKGVKPCVT